MGTGKKQVKTSSCSRYLVNLIEVALAGAKLDSKFRRRQEDKQLAVLLHNLQDL